MLSEIIHLISKHGWVGLWRRKRLVRGGPAGANEGDADPATELVSVLHADPPLDPLPGKNCNIRLTQARWWAWKGSCRGCRGWNSREGPPGGDPFSPSLSLELVVENCLFLGCDSPRISPPPPAQPATHHTSTEFVRNCNLWTFFQCDAQTISSACVVVMIPQLFRSLKEMLGLSPARRED